MKRSEHGHAARVDRLDDLGERPLVPDELRRAMVLLEVGAGSRVERVVLRVAHQEHVVPARRRLGRHERRGRWGAGRRSSGIGDGCGRLGLAVAGEVRRHRAIAGSPLHAAERSCARAGRTRGRHTATGDRDRAPGLDRGLGADSLLLHAPPRIRRSPRPCTNGWLTRTTGEPDSAHGEHVAPAQVEEVAPRQAATPSAAPGRSLLSTTQSRAGKRGGRALARAGPRRQARPGHGHAGAEPLRGRRARPVRQRREGARQRRSHLEGQHHRDGRLLPHARGHERGRRRRARGSWMRRSRRTARRAPPARTRTASP